MSTINFVGVNSAAFTRKTFVNGNGNNTNAITKKNSLFGLEKASDNENTVGKNLFEETSPKEATAAKPTENPEVENLIKQYKLDEKQAAVLRKVDLNETLKDGSPKYSLVHVKRDEGRKDDGYYVVENSLDSLGRLSGKIIDTSSTKDREWGITGSFNYKLTDTKEIGNESTETELPPCVDENVPTDKTQNNVGTQNQTIAGGNVIIVGGDNYGPINGGGNVNNGGKDVNTPQPEPVSAPEPEPETVKKPTGKIGIGENSFISPLVLDTNRDGQVSATHGMGIDIDGDGKADGAATGGDKMLAMSDLNGNNKIDGAEVFGNKTVSPFTGKELNAKNGFEALKTIAEEAEAKGFKCIKDGKVDVQELSKALGTVNVKLGFVSDNNNTTIEDLNGIKSIDVENYVETNDTGNVQHRQKGFFSWLDGTLGKIDDVWFKRK